MLVHTVVVAGDDARADVYAVADDGIAEIGEMVGLGAAPQSGFLGLAKIADVRLLADAAFGAEMRVGSNHRAVADFRAVEDAPVADGDPIAEDGILHDRVRAHAAVGADAGDAEQLHVRLDDGVRTDRDLGVDDARFGPEDGNALCHQAFGDGNTDSVVEMHHFGDGVGAEDLVDAAGLEGNHAAAVGDQHRGDVGEVELTVSVVGGEPIELLEKRLGFEAVDTGVDLGGGELRRRERLLLDDRCHFGRSGSGAEDAAVTGGILRDGGEDGHGCALGEVQVAERRERFRLYERDIAGEHEEMLRDWKPRGLQPLAEFPVLGLAGGTPRLRENKVADAGALRASLQVGFKLLHGVAGAELDLLQNEPNAGGLGCGADAIGLVANDAVNAVCRDQRLCRCDDVQQKGAATHLVQHFGALAVQPRAFARGHDSYCETCCFHARYLLTRTVLAPLEGGSIIDSKRGSDGDEHRCSGH